MDQRHEVRAWTLVVLNHAISSCTSLKALQEQSLSRTGCSGKAVSKPHFFAADEQSTGGGFVSNANDILNGLHVFKFTSRVLICSYVY
jgi:hypothetical protein